MVLAIPFLVNGPHFAGDEFSSADSLDAVNMLLTTRSQEQIMLQYLMLTSTFFLESLEEFEDNFMRHVTKFEEAVKQLVSASSRSTLSTDADISQSSLQARDLESLVVLTNVFEDQVASLERRVQSLTAEKELLLVEVKETQHRRDVPSGLCPPPKNRHSPLISDQEVMKKAHCRRQVSPVASPLPQSPHSPLSSDQAHPGIRPYMELFTSSTDDRYVWDIPHKDVSKGGLKSPVFVASGFRWQLELGVPDPRIVILYRVGHSCRVDFKLTLYHQDSAQDKHLTVRDWPSDFDGWGVADFVPVHELKASGFVVDRSVRIGLRLLGKPSRTNPTP